MKETEDRRKWVLAALDEFERRLVRYAQRLDGNEEEARDVVQFVFLRLCDEQPEKIGERLGQWLFTVCRNRAMDILRTSGREKVNGKANHQPEASSREADPAETIEQTDLHAVLRQVLDRLPASQREAIDLWAEGFSYRDISGILQCEEGNVRVLVHRGLKAVKEHPRVTELMDEPRESGPEARVQKSEVRSGR